MVDRAVDNSINKAQGVDEGTRTTVCTSTGSVESVCSFGGVSSCFGSIADNSDDSVTITSGDDTSTSSFVDLPSDSEEECYDEIPGGDGVVPSNEAAASRSGTGTLQSGFLPSGNDMPVRVNFVINIADGQGVDDCCRNCHRCRSPGFDELDSYRVDLHKHGIDDIEFSLQNSLSFSSDQLGSRSDVLLCNQCTELITISNRKRRKQKKDPWYLCWPVYFWKFLSCAYVLDDIGACVLQHVPRQWIHYWVAELHCHYPAVFASDRLDYYLETQECVVVDVTYKTNEMKRMWKELRLGDMKTTSNSYLFPLVLCPWGCSAYFHEQGAVMMDAVFTKFFPAIPVAGKYCTKSEAERVAGCRSDFFSTSIDSHLCLDDWCVRASVVYEEGVGPMFKTCSDHNRGDRNQYFHLPKTGVCLPSKYPDSLSPVVLRTRTLKPSKPKAFSNEYRLQKMTASYCGIDTAVLSQWRSFDYHSHLDDLVEARSFAHRDDIKGLAMRLREKGAISSEYLSNIGVRARELFPNADREGMRGSTVALLQDCIALQKSLRSNGFIEVKTICDATKKEGTRSFLPNWPSFHFRVHSFDGFGCQMPLVRPFLTTKDGDVLWLFWFFCNCVCCVEEIWALMHVRVVTDICWEGFFLSFLSRSVMMCAVRNNRRRNPFYVGDWKPMFDPKHLSSVILGDGKSSSVSERLRLVLESGAGGRGADDGGAVVIDMFKTLTLAECLGRNHRRIACCDVVVVVNNCGNDSVRLSEESVHVGGFNYELRFLSCKEETAGSWTGECWSRHGGSFQSWWRNIKRHGRLLREGSLARFPTETFFLAVFVKIKPVLLDKLRKEYLGYIGGQSNIFCQEHDLPLVTVGTRLGEDKATCCLQHNGIRCTRKEDLQCPVGDCACCVCKQCRRRVGGDDVYVEPIGHLRTIRASRPAGGDDIGHHLPEEDAISTDTTVGGSSNGEPNGLDELHQGYDQPMFDIEQCPGDDNEEYDEMDDGEFDGLIPTSHESRRAPCYDFDLGCMGTSVLLNKFGTVLVRRDNRLQATKRERNLVERVVSVKDMGSIPLVYLEGILFPSIFWCQPRSAAGGLLGAIPTALFCQKSTQARYKIASVAKHARVRLKAIGNTASTNSNYLSFLFDSIANGALGGKDSRIALCRGFEDSMGAAGLRVKNQDDDFYTDTIDNRQTCHNLCAGEKDLPTTLFITLTCNQHEHFGISKIKRYIDSDDSLNNYKRFVLERFGIEEFTAAEEREIKFAIHEAAKGLLVRNWMEVRKLLIEYLMKSDELPLGSRVLKIFARDEYQGEAGNLSHVHMLVSLERSYDTEEGRLEIQRVIRGFVSEIVGIDEVQSFVDEKVLDNWEDFLVMKDQAQRILPHSCSSHRCLRRTGPGKTQVACRVPDTRKLSNDITSFCERKIDVKHTPDALRIFERLGFCQGQDANGGRFVPLREFLESKRVMAPARHGEGNMTPVIGRVFAAVRSSMNAQICTSFGTSRYLVKYLSKIDENNYVVFSAKQGAEDEFRVEKVNLLNTKIASSAKNEDKKMNASRHKNRPRGRAIAQTEMMQIMLGYPQIFTNIEYVKIPTLALGERAGVPRMSPAERYQKSQAGQEDEDNAGMFKHFMPHVAARRHFFEEGQLFRCHTESQEVLLEDQLWSTVSLDRVTIFGGRPPELLIVDKLEWYYKFFVRDKRAMSVDELEVTEFPHIGFTSWAKDDVARSFWVDGFGFRVKLRSEAIPLVAELLTDTSFRDNATRRGYNVVLALLDDICRFHQEVGLTTFLRPGEQFRPLRTRSENKKWKEMQEIFVSIDENQIPKRLPVPVFSNVRPKNATKFIIHLLLSMGHFDTETDLWSRPSLAAAFAEAKIIPLTHELPFREEDCDRLLSLWIETQLRFYPVSSRIMDDWVCSADKIIRAVLLEGDIPISEVPPCLYTHLFDSNAAKVIEYQKQVKTSVVKATLNAMRLLYPEDGVLPTEAALMEATVYNPVAWDQRLPRTEQQSQRSHEEQATVQSAVQNQVNHYVSSSMTATRNFAIVGPPGVGKTHCLLHSVLYALAKGLFAVTTAMLAERAFLLGGQHFHKLFKLKVKDITNRPHRMAELAVIALQRHPELISLLRRIDVLFVDEMGQLSAELLSVLDIILRRVRGSSLFMGGVLVIGTLDQVQLRPIKELPFLLSPYVLTTFIMGKLVEYVRCTDCPALQEMNQLARTFTSTAEEKEEVLARFERVALDNCTFVESWDDAVVTDSVLRVFPKRCDAAEATKMYLQRKRREVLQRGRPYRTCKARDTMVGMESHGEWADASSVVVSHLNRTSSEPAKLDFFWGAIYQFTFNSPGNFNATQLAVLIDVPSAAEIKAMCPITVYAAPPGTKTASFAELTSEELLRLGWTKVSVGVAPEYTSTLYQQGMKAKRKQYGLKHHIASTVHCSIGHTMTKIATSLNAKTGIWERAMVVVLISRVKKATDIIFVGSPRDNIEALKSGLRIRCQYDEYMNHVVDSLCGGINGIPTQPISLSHHPCRPRDIALPVDTSGCVYLLVSVRDERALYVGMTQNLPLRLNQHNSGYGAKRSCSPMLRPWALYAYVAGFSANRDLMRKFERSWQGHNAMYDPRSAAASVGLANTISDQYYTDYKFKIIVSV